SLIECCWAYSAITRPTPGSTLGLPWCRLSSASRRAASRQQPRHSSGDKRPGARLKIKARLGAHLLLRRTRRIRVYFARNGLARLRCLSGVEFFVRSATAKGGNSTSEENETAAFHGEINNRRVLDFQRR